jgi:hypothetical protein
MAIQPLHSTPDLGTQATQQAQKAQASRATNNTTNGTNTANTANNTQQTQHAAQQPKPVVNGQGQTTGKIVNATA